MKKIELLSPAGDLEHLKIALLYGADAVYIGGKDYSLRANATNFSLEEIAEACDFAHQLEKKVYLTLNIIFHNEDLNGVYEYIDKIVKAGIDAFIVSDLFLVSYLKKNYPEVEIHISTQNSTTNIESVKFLKSIGATRVVLARELSKAEIKEIIAETKMDMEVFIHGAMCTFYSGRCTLSNYCTNRDSNRGGCSQVCRFAFLIDDEDDNFTMATKDLNMSYYLKELLDTGVKSLKIEGRMRSIYYLATVISSYRRLIEAYYSKTLTEEMIARENKILDRVANRDTSTHYFMKEADLSDQYYTGRQELSNQDFLGLVIDYDSKTKFCTISQRNYFKKGDVVEIFTPLNQLFEITLDKFYNEKGEVIDCARHPEEIIKFKVEKEIPIFSMMRIKI